MKPEESVFHCICINDYIHELKGYNQCLFYKPQIRLIETVIKRDFKPVKENRKIHQVCSSKSATVEIRKLSCYTCENCFNTDYNDCLDVDQIVNFSILKMIKENADQESEDEEIADEIEQLYDLVSTGTFFAVKADSVNQPYYLVNTNKQTTVLRKESTDKYGIIYPEQK
ncbi:unnamed protein product [Mytilus coruscus]|uniref:Uncharacterized protein n=1 Tax=Mytilus coruscus TaxID=42192 RepID=A0A6J8BWY3_MYTCO|nr:unnamed protein product [Mytilus coruscus]